MRIEGTSSLSSDIASVGRAHLEAKNLVIRPVVREEHYVLVVLGLRLNLLLERGQLYLKGLVLPFLLLSMQFVNFFRDLNS